jgi:ABC-type transporter lipoprotein component MlaA
MKSAWPLQCDTSEIFGKASRIVATEDFDHDCEEGEKASIAERVAQLNANRSLIRNSIKEVEAHREALGQRRGYLGDAGDQTDEVSEEDRDR